METGPILQRLCYIWQKNPRFACFSSSKPVPLIWGPREASNRGENIKDDHRSARRRCRGRRLEHQKPFAPGDRRQPARRDQPDEAPAGVDRHPDRARRGSRHGPSGGHQLAFDHIEQDRRAGRPRAADRHRGDRSGRLVRLQAPDAGRRAGLLVAEFARRAALLRALPGGVASSGGALSDGPRQWAARAHARCDRGGRRARCLRGRARHRRGRLAGNAVGDGGGRDHPRRCT